MASHSDFSSRPILIVERDTDLRRSLQSVLTDSGYETAEAVDHLDALAYLTRHRRLPERILIDVSAPFAENWELVEILRREPRWRRIPVTLISSSAKAPGVRARGRSLAPDSVILPMPFEFDELLGALAGEELPEILTSEELGEEVA